MKITYGLLILERLIHKGSAHYAHLKQHINCELSNDEVQHESELLGFNSNGSCTREVYYRIPARTQKEDFELFLQSYPDARIIRIIDNEAVLSQRQRERVQSGVVSMADIAKTQVILDKDKRAVIDLFGLAVYGQNRLSLSGNLQDQDYRWPLTASGAEIEDAQETKSQLTLTKERIKV